MGDAVIRIGLTIFPTDRSIRPDVLAREAESRGFESLFVCEHTHWPVSTEQETGRPRSDEFARSLDPFVALTAAAIATTNLRVGTAICLPAQRDHFHLAKEAASVDLLSSGRLILGVGAGWNVAEARNHGIDPDRRWRVMADRMKAVRALWADDVAEYHGQYVDFGPAESHPDPVQRPGPPVLVGGNGPRVLARVVDYGDGWLPYAQKADQLAPQIQSLRELADAAGRSEPTVTIFAAPADRALLDGYAAIGVQRALVHLPAATADETLRALDQLTAVVP